MSLNTDKSYKPNSCSEEQYLSFYEPTSYLMEEPSYNVDYTQKPVYQYPVNYPVYQQYTTIAQSQMFQPGHVVQYPVLSNPSIPQSETQGKHSEKSAKTMEKSLLFAG